MTAIRTLVTQAGNDVFTATEIALPALDGKSGYNIMGVSAYWTDIVSMAPADVTLDAVIQTSETEVTFEDVDWIASVSWGLFHMSSVSANDVEPMKSRILQEPRVTVQPEIFAAVRSSGTSQANDVIVEVVYELVKLSELDYLRLLAGGA